MPRPAGCPGRCPGGAGRPPDRAAVGSGVSSGRRAARARRSVAPGRCRSNGDDRPPAEPVGLRPRRVPRPGRDRGPRPPDRGRADVHRARQLRRAGIGLGRGSRPAARRAHRRGVGGGRRPGRRGGLRRGRGRGCAPPGHGGHARGACGRRDRPGLSRSLRRSRRHRPGYGCASTRAAGRGDAGTVRAIARVAGVRLILLVPVAIVAAVAIPAWVAVAYRELTVPSDVAAPLAARVLAGAPAASVAVLAAWLAAEVVGGFAARRSVLLGASMLRALAGGLVDPFRAPLATALTVAVALGATLVALVATWWVTGVAWDAARQALGGGPGRAGRPRGGAPAWPPPGWPDSCSRPGRPPGGQRSSRWSCCAGAAERPATLRRVRRRRPAARARWRSSHGGG